MNIIFKILLLFLAIVVGAYIVAGITLFIVAIYAGLEDEKEANQ